jgi:hypothetical protein
MVGTEFMKMGSLYAEQSSNPGAAPEEKVRKTTDAAYEIRTDEYLSVVRCAILARTG